MGNCFFIIQMNLFAFVNNEYLWGQCRFVGSSKHLITAGPGYFWLSTHQLASGLFFRKPAPSVVTAVLGCITAQGNSEAWTLGSVYSLINFATETR